MRVTGGQREQKALANFEAWAKRNEWARKIAIVMTRKLLEGRR